MGIQRVDDETNVVLADNTGIQVIVTYGDGTSKQYDFETWAGFKKNLALVKGEAEGKTVAAFVARDLAVPLPRAATPRAQRAAIEAATIGAAETNG
jgi:predicted phosphodiesterase